ncbi:MAG: putative ABC transport system permease protein [Granulosicoccus sp.]|jgi:putative ABC transport system permease protein
MIKHIFTLIWNKKKKNFLLFLEIFFSFMILFAVFAFIISNMRVYYSPLGFDTKNVWAANLRIPSSSDSTEIAEMKTLLLQELNAMPEVESVSFSAGAYPFSGNTWSTGNDKNGFDFQTCIFFNDEHYAKTAGLNIIEGRWFEEADNTSKYTPVLITKKFREQCFAGKPVLDSLFILEDDAEESRLNNVKIIGVVDHYKYDGEFAEEELGTFIYTPSTSKDTWVTHLRMNNNVQPDAEEKLNKMIASVTKRADFSIRKLEQRRIQNSQSTWTPMIALMSISGFLIINVALGLFGVLWYNISKRRSEIGLRRTVGATGSDISFQFITEIIMVTLIGIFVGLFFAAQFPIMKLFDIENINYYYAMLSSAGVILLLVLICAFYPSRQAAMVNPAMVLHED